MSIERLIPNFTTMDQTTLTDFWTLVAHNLENAFMQCGMIPDEDYTAKDLFQLTQPFVLATWRNKDAELTVVFP